MNFVEINSIKDLAERKKYLLENVDKSKIDEYIKLCSHKVKEAFNTEQSIKLTLNASYGAIASKYFIAHATDVAEAITLQGQDLIKYSEIVANKYFKEIWHNDVQLHEKLGILGKVRKIDENKALVTYIDTDSIAEDSIIDVDGIKMCIKDYFDSYSEYDGYLIDDRGNEIILTPKSKVLNWTIDKGLYYAKVAKIIRHNVHKPKWRLKTKSGKEILVTNDHSLIVFRNGCQLTVKAKDINIKTDKILEVIY